MSEDYNGQGHIVHRRPSLVKVSVFHSSKAGSLEGLSKEVEECLRSALVEGEILPYLEKLKASLNPRSRARPEGRGLGAGAQIRSMSRKAFGD